MTSLALGQHVGRTAEWLMKRARANLGVPDEPQINSRVAALLIAKIMGNVSTILGKPIDAETTEASIGEDLKNIGMFVRLLVELSKSISVADDANSISHIASGQISLLSKTHEAHLKAGKGVSHHHICCALASELSKFISTPADAISILVSEAGLLFSIKHSVAMSISPAIAEGVLGAVKLTDKPNSGLNSNVRSALENRAKQSVDKKPAPEQASAPSLP